MENILTVSGLKKQFRNNRGISDVSFSIEKGDVFGLLGANGAGKTTTMKIIAGLMRKGGGKITVFGEPLETSFEKASYHIGSLIETPAFYGYLSAYENLRLASRFYTASRFGRDEIETLLKDVKLYDYRNDRVGKFSLGMKQRLGLALAMIGKPDLYILDEPSNGLDIEGIVEIRNIILGMAANRNASFLLSSHQSAEIQKTCNKVGVIHNGVLKESALVNDILSNFPSVEDYYLYVIGSTERRIPEQEGVRLQ
ncbi:MAG: ABC transporter ATP-binding protein [Clostridiales bacterium]|nr:ABC transporter ATP-binding protein [Clostridiales bacterium]